MQENDIKKALKEIKGEAKELVGWPNLQITGINKYGVEAVLYTIHGKDLEKKGTMKIPMKDLFLQHNFRIKVFEILGEMVEKMKGNIYEEWLMEWSRLIVDMGMEYGTSIEVMKDALVEYLEGAEDTDLSYLKKGNPIVLPEGCIAFKSVEFMMHVKKKYSMNYTEDQVRAVLKEIGCKPRQLGPMRIRVWTYELPTMEKEGQAEIKFEGVGRAPDVMTEDNQDDY